MLSRIELQGLMQGKAAATPQHDLQMRACTPGHCLLETIGTGSGCGSVVECGLPKPEMRVRFPSPAPISTGFFSIFLILVTV